MSLSYWLNYVILGNKKCTKDLAFIKKSADFEFCKKIYKTNLARDMK